MPGLTTLAEAFATSERLRAPPEFLMPCSIVSKVGAFSIAEFTYDLPIILLCLWEDVLLFVSELRRLWPERPFFSP